MKYGIIGLAVALGGYFVYAQWSGRGAPLAVSLKCMNEGCGYVTSRRPQLGDEFPARCPKCDQQTLVPAVPCNGCGTPVILNEERGLKPPTICPKCGREIWHGD